MVAGLYREERPTFESQPTRHLVLYSVSYDYVFTGWHKIMNQRLSAKTKRRICKKVVRFVGFSQLRPWPVLVKFAFFKCLYWPSKRELYFDFSVRHFVCECHNICNQRTWYEVKRRRDVFIRIFLYLFQNGGRFQGPFHNYGLRVRSSVHKTRPD